MARAMTITAKRQIWWLLIVTSLILLVGYLFKGWKLLTYSGPINHGFWIDRAVYAKQWDIMLPATRHLGGSWVYRFDAGQMEPWSHAYADALLECQLNDPYLNANEYFQQNGWVEEGNIKPWDTKRMWKKDKTIVYVGCASHSSGKSMISLMFFIME